MTVVKNLTTVKLSNSAGAINDTILYDLKVFNYLVMRLDTDQAWEKKAKFKNRSSTTTKQKEKADWTPHPIRLSGHPEIGLNDMSPTAFEHRRLSHDDENI